MGKRIKSVGAGVDEVLAKYGLIRSSRHYEPGRDYRKYCNRIDQPKF